MYKILQNKIDIIYNVLKFMETKENRYKETALKLLKPFAVSYQLGLVRTKPSPDKLYKILIEFIENKQGTKITINKLYNKLS